MVSTIEFIYNQQSRSQITPLCLVFMGGSHLMPFLCTPSITNLQMHKFTPRLPIQMNLRANKFLAHVDTTPATFM